ncbi:hypothetical protein BH10PLA2_BH10PLA2_06650 [soil metagenome]
MTEAEWLEPHRGHRPSLQRREGYFAENNHKLTNPGDQSLLNGWGASSGEI